MIITTLASSRAIVRATHIFINLVRIAVVVVVVVVTHLWVSQAEGRCVLAVTRMPA